MANERKDIRTQIQLGYKLQTLMHKVNKETLMKQHEKQQIGKAPGIDGVTKEKYEEHLGENIDELLLRMKKFSYKPKPVRRTEIPKANGKMRPLGIPCYEDRLVQGAMADVLNEIYECKFYNFSYGFRTNIGCHRAISQINYLLMTRKINYVVDADIKGFFDNIDHDIMMMFLEHDIQDKNFLRYIKKFLKSGVMKEDKCYKTNKGTPQGGLISPVLANVYLHYVLDNWFVCTVKPKLKGEAYLIRYADDYVVMFQYEEEAKMFYQMLNKRMKQFKLELAEDKTRIVPFGRFKGTDETFDFLGFTFSNSKTLTGKYRPQIKTSKKKMKQKKENVKKFLVDNMHKPVIEVGKKLKKKIIGHFTYYGVNGNFVSLLQYYKYIKYEWYRILRRRGQKKPIKYEDYLRIWNALEIPKPKIYVNVWS